MKKTLIFIFILFTIPNLVFAKDSVTLNKCVDGDTVWLNKNGETIKARLLAVDTPETKHPKKGVEPYGKEASKFTCNALKKAQKIEIEYDKNSEKKDKYERDLVWLFTDNELLQDKLVKNGLAKVAYLYDDYEYTNTLLNSEKNAKNKKIGIWSTYENDINYPLIIIGVIIFIILICINAKYRNKVKNKIKRKVKKKFNNELKKIVK